MVFSQILMGTLIILLLFSVGESVLNSAKLSKSLILVFLISCFVSSFFPSIKIANSEFYVAGFVVPLILSVFFCFKLNSVYSLLRILVCVLLVSVLLLVYNSINLESISYNLLQPYILLGLVIGVASFFICKTFSASFIGVFVGSVVTSLIYYAIQNQTIGGTGFVFGSEQILTIILTASFMCLFSTYISRKVRYLRRKRERKLSTERQRSA